MSVLLIAEHNNKELKAFTFNAITAASQVDGDVHALLIGNNCADVAKSLSEIPLIKKVIQVEAAHYENFLPENFAPLVVKVSENYSHVISSANTFGKNLAEESSISSFIGSWISAMVMVPFGIFLTRRATKDKGLFNIDAILLPIKNLFLKLKSKKDL